MENPKKLATLGTQDEEKQEYTIQRSLQHWVHKTKKNKNGQSRETCNIGYTRPRKTRIDNPEKLVTLGTQDEDKQEWTIQRNL